MKYIIRFLFSSLIFGIGVLGESYKVNLFGFLINFNLLIALLLCISFLVNLNETINHIDKILILFIGLLFFSLGISVRNNNNLSYALEDSIPLLIFIIVNLSVKHFTYSEIPKLIKLYSLISILCFVKLLMVWNFGNVDKDMWQVAVLESPGITARISLKGGAIFFVLATTIMLLGNKKKIDISYSRLIISLIAGSVGLFFSQTRTYFISIGVSFLVFTLFYFTKFNFKQKIRFVFFSFFFFLIVLSSGLLNNIQARTDYDEENSSYEWRVLESVVIYEDLTEKKLLLTGKGLGGGFYMPWASGSMKPDSLDLYAHNIFVWILLKFGFIGLMFYVSFLTYFIDKAIRGINFYYIINREKSDFFFLGLISLITILIIDLSANTTVTLSGGLTASIVFALLNNSKLN